MFFSDGKLLLRTVMELSWQVRYDLFCKLDVIWGELLLDNRNQLVVQIDELRVPLKNTPRWLDIAFEVTSFVEHYHHFKVDEVPVV
jgi:hypothetical protein